MAKNYWWVYMIETDKGLLYTGIATDVERRFNEHKSNPKKAAKFFRGKVPLNIVFRQACNDRSTASKVEAAIKKCSRAQKFAIIEQGHYPLI